MSRVVRPGGECWERTRSARFAALGGFLVATALGVSSVPSLAASDLQEELQRRWEGAWVVLTVPSFSNCDGFHTNNEVVASDGRVELVSKGDLSFASGELARVSKLDLKRRRVDLLVELWEPLLVAYRDGPFELYRDSVCKVELMFPLDREVVKSQRAEPVEREMASVVARYTDEASARQDERFNDRRIEPLPEDYEQTWIDYQVWKYSEALQDAGDEIERVADRSRHRDDPEYVLGYAKGLKHYHSLPSDCLALAEATPPYVTGSPPGHYDRDQKDDWKAGYADGAKVSFLTRAIAELSSCLAGVR